MLFYWMQYKRQGNRVNDQIANPRTLLVSIGLAKVETQRIGQTQGKRDFPKVVS